MFLYKMWGNEGIDIGVKENVLTVEGGGLVHERNRSQLAFVYLYQTARVS